MSDTPLATPENLRSAANDVDRLATLMVGRASEEAITNARAGAARLRVLADALDRVEQDATLRAHLAQLQQQFDAGLSLSHQSAGVVVRALVSLIPSLGAGG